MSESEAAGAPSGVPMGSWRVTYTPGDWMVFAGPKALVVMPPAPAHVSQLLNDLWDDVSQAGSIDHLLHTLSSYGADGMPYLAAFFWDFDGMHSLVRGPLAVIDLTTGNVVNHGEGVRSWREVGLGELAQVRVDFQDVDQSTLVQLPLVTGAVTASAIVLDSQGFVPAFAADDMPNAVVAVSGSDELMPDAESAGGEAIVAEAAQPDDFPEPPANSTVAEMPASAEQPDQQVGQLTEEVWQGDESADEQLVDPRDDANYDAQSVAGGMAEPSPDTSVDVQPEAIDRSAPQPVTDAPEPGVDGIDVTDEVSLASPDQGALPDGQPEAGSSEVAGIPWATESEHVDTSGAPQLDANPFAHLEPGQPAVHSAFSDLQDDDNAAWPSDGGEVPPAPPADWPQAEQATWSEAPSQEPFQQPTFNQGEPDDGRSAQPHRQPEQPAYGQPEHGQQEQPQYGQPQYGQPQYAQPQGYGQPEWQDPSRQPQQQFGQVDQPYGQPQGAPSYAAPFGQQPGAGQPGQFGQPQAYGQPGQFGEPQAYGQPGQFGQPQGHGQPGQFGNPAPYEPPAQQRDYPAAPMPQQWQQQAAAGWQPPAAPQEGSASGFTESSWGDQDDSHDGATIFSSGIAHKPAAASSDDARLAVFCPVGHPNPPGSHRCRVCRDSVDPRQSRPIDSLVLATIEVSTGEHIALTGPVLIGRAPNAGGQDPKSKLVTVPSPSHDISRTHVSITPREWNIEVADLHSTNGTVIIPPGESPIDLESGERVTVDLGTMIDLGDGITITLGDPR